MEQPNMSYINSLAGDDMVFRQRLIDTIKAEFPDEITHYEHTLQSKDFTAAAAAVHKLKHKISVLGMEDSYRLAEQYENNLKAGTVSLSEKFENTLGVMQDFVNSL